MKSKSRAGRSTFGVITVILLIGAVLLILHWVGSRSTDKPDRNLILPAVARIHYEAGKQIERLTQQNTLDDKQTAQAAARVNAEADRQIKKVLDEISK